MVEVRQFDQYVVRVDGSGRVTLRNRKFLRKYIPVQPLSHPRSILSDMPNQPSSSHVDTKSQHDSSDKREIWPTVSSQPTLEPDLAAMPPSTVDDDIIPVDTPTPLNDSEQPTRVTPKRAPRMLTNLKTYNKPGLLDQPIQSEDTDTGPRRSHRLKDA